MKRFSKPLRAVAALLAGLGAAAAVSAAPVYLIDATVDAQPPDGGLSNVAFSLIYEDFDLNMLFSLGELLTFGGFIDGGGTFYDQLLEVPDANGIEASNPATNQWRFGNGADEVAFGAQRFTPFTTPVGFNGVPVAGSGWLVALGLLGTVGFARRRAA